MLETVKAPSLDALIDEIVPRPIRLAAPLTLAAETEAGYLQRLRGIAAKNRVCRSYIGMGYHDTHTPAVITRNVFENPGWYTPYTPYQAEIAQGRLESLLNFQTMVEELTGMPVANASLLDEATAAAEAVSMAHALARGGTSNVVAVAADLFPQTRAVLETRARPLGFRVVEFAPGDLSAIGAANPFAVVLQYPGSSGAIRSLSEEIDA